MKVKQLPNGKWAVPAGKNKHWPETISDTKEEAIERGLIRQVTYLRWKSEEAYEKLVKKYPDKYTDINNCRESDKCTYGDLIA